MTGSNGQTAVKWAINGIPSGNATVGTIIAGRSLHRSDDASDPQHYSGNSDQPGGYDSHFHRNDNAQQSLAGSNSSAAHRHSGG